MSTRPNAAGFFLTVIITEKIVRLQMRGSYLSPVLSSLSCVPVYHASDSAPIFFFALPKKKTAAGGQKKKSALYRQDKGSIQPALLAAASACRA